MRRALPESGIENLWQTNHTMKKQNVGNFTGKRIALVANSSWYTYNFRLGLLRRLKDEGFEVYVLAPQDHYSNRLVAEGFHFIHLPIGI